MANRSWLLDDDDASWLKLQSFALIEETTAFLQSKVALAAGIDRKALKESLNPTFDSPRKFKYLKHCA